MSSPTVLHVATTGSDTNAGTETAPLRSISAAASRAMPGDTVRVHQGVYREWVRPARGGLSDLRRITYEAAPGEQVVITGAEVVTGWEREPGAPSEDPIWRVRVPAETFGEFNPFAHRLWGDWLVLSEYGGAPTRGEVYLDGRSLTQVFDLASVRAHPVRTAVVDGWTRTPQPFADPEWTQAVWYAQVDPEATTIWAHFPSNVDPNESLTEINVRPAVFYPQHNHLDWITVRGFELAQAASPWTPPTADQPGLIGPNWAKGWIIEDNDIHDAKCSGVSLGKEASTGHNYAATRGDKPGYQYQLESVFAALEQGWSKDRIGSHIVRNNHIHDCGQNGIVGHLGAAFSRIEHNHIHHIGTKREFFGHELGGIKLHAAIDTQIVGNRIDHCTLGTWLDWETQGTRICGNLYYANTRDFFVEVSHGPYLVDHNVFASPVAIEIFSQGGAYVNNLIAGAVRVGQELDRATQYHRPHSTAVAGFANVLAGDDRWIGNLFIGDDFADAMAPGATWLDKAPLRSGTSAYHGFPAGWAGYVEALNAPGDHERFGSKRQGVYIHDNVYLAGAQPYEQEQGAREVPGAASVQITETEGPVYLELDLPAAAVSPLPNVTIEQLPRVRFVDAEFENPDGTPVQFERDLLGAVKQTEGQYPAGPLATLGAGKSRIPVW